MAEISPNQDLSENKLFSFDKNFQEKIVQAMLIDHPWASQFAEVVEISYFTHRYLKLIVDRHLTYYRTYKEFPSMDLLLGILKDELKAERDEILREQVKIFLIKVGGNENLGDLPFVKEKALDFCKRAALQKALNDSIDLIKSEKYEKIIEVVKTAIHAGNHHSPGLDLFEDISARYSETFRKTIPTGIQELDQRKILNGGLGAGELGVVIAPSGVGKSHALVHMGAYAILAGKSVVHYTYELNERAVGVRYDSHLVNIPSLDCYEAKDVISKFYSDNEDNLGRLKIKYYPTGTATTMTLKCHIEKLATQGFKPDMVIVDYSGIMRSTERHDLLRMELKKIMEELRSMAAELDVPVWTAIQSNKEGTNSDVVDLTNMAEAYSQAHIADFVIGLSRKSAQKATGFGNIFIAKNRAGIDGIKYQIHLDTSKSKLRILTDDEIADFNNGNNDFEDDEIKLIRQKLTNINNRKKNDNNNN